MFIKKITIKLNIIFKVAHCNLLLTRLECKINTIS